MTIEGDIADHLEIRNLLARYCLHLDLLENEEWISLFTEDCTYRVHGKVWEGHDGIRRIVEGAPQGLHLGGATEIVSITPSGASDGSGDTAVTRHNLLFLENGSTELRRVLYRDKLVRQDGSWKFAERHVQFLTADGIAERPER